MVDDPGRDAVRHRSLTLLRPSQEIKPLEHFPIILGHILS